MQTAPDTFTMHFTNLKAGLKTSPFLNIHPHLNVAREVPATESPHKLTIHTRPCADKLERIKAELKLVRLPFAHLFNAEFDRILTPKGVFRFNITKRELSKYLKAQIGSKEKVAEGMSEVKTPYGLFKVINFLELGWYALIDGGEWHCVIKLPTKKDLTRRLNKPAVFRPKLEALSRVAIEKGLIK